MPGSVKLEASTLLHALNDWTARSQDWWRGFVVFRIASLAGLRLKIHAHP